MSNEAITPEEQALIDARVRGAEVEAQRASAQAAESTARFLKTGLLPRSVATLEFIPPASRAQYTRDFTGAFQLAWLDLSDSVGLLEYNDLIADGRMTAHPRGWTVEGAARKNAAAHKMSDDILSAANEADAKERDERRHAQLDAAQRKINARFGR